MQMGIDVVPKALKTDLISVNLPAFFIALIVFFFYFALLMYIRTLLKFIDWHYYGMSGMYIFVQGNVSISKKV